MKRHALAVIVLSAFLAPAGGVGASEEAAAIEVRSGTASFAVATNLLGMIVHGKSTALEARAVVRQDRDGIAVERIEAALPIMSLTTGLAARRAHAQLRVHDARRSAA